VFFGSKLGAGLSANYCVASDLAEVFTSTRPGDVFLFAAWPVFGLLRRFNRGTLASSGRSIEMLGKPENAA
jgi:hypothetical protein